MTVEYQDTASLKSCISQMHRSEILAKSHHIFKTNQTIVPRESMFPPSDIRDSQRTYRICNLSSKVGELAKST